MGLGFTACIVYGSGFRVFKDSGVRVSLRVAPLKCSGLGCVSTGPGRACHAVGNGTGSRPSWIPRGPRVGLGYLKGHLSVRPCNSQEPTSV